jgi:GT2 family glycosyltransferase/glycosyltransferase involved in cell wall biosynthesis
MRVLVVVHGFPPDALGGSELYAQATSLELQRCYGDKILVVTREASRERSEYSIRREDRDGLQIVWMNNTFSTTRSFEETYRNDTISAAAERLIDEFRPDVAHVHHLTCLSTTIVPALARRGVPVVLTLHDYWLMCHRGQLLDTSYRLCDGPDSGCQACLGLAGNVGVAGFMGAGLVRSIERRWPLNPGLRRAAERAGRLLASDSAGDAEARKRVAHMRTICADVTQFFAPSRTVRDRFVVFGINPDKIVVSPYGVDAAPFQSVSREPRRPLRVGYLGSLMISKGPDVLLRAIARLPQGSAAVDVFGGFAPYHGDDSYRRTLEPLLRHPDVSAHGALPHEQVPRALASLDVLVVPSIWPETSSFVIKEAQLAGVPVIASRIGGFVELIEHGRNGLMFEPGNVQELQSLLQQLLDDPETLLRLRRSPNEVRRLADDVRATREVYEQLAGAHRPAPATRQAPSSRRLAAVVLNYRAPDDTLLAVRSLLASNRTIDRIIVIDNDTNGAAHQALAPLQPHLTYQATGANLGFSGGMNVGIRLALADGAERVLLLNSDVIVPPDCVAALEDALESAPGAGIVGPVILSRSQPDQIATAGMTYDAGTGRMRHRLHGHRAAEPFVANESVAGVSGCCMLVTQAVWEGVGLLDEEYFFGFEDLDLCLRARGAGFNTIVASAALAYHEGSRSIGADSPRRLYFAARNHLRLASRLAPRTSIGSLSRSAAIVALNLAHAARARGSSLPIRLTAVLRGAGDYALGRFGAGRESS